MLRTGRSMRDWVGGFLACLLCIGLLTSLAVMDTGGTKATRVRPPAAAAAAAAAVSSSRMRSMGSMSLDPFISSKRGVPNGPDPIHNRRTGKSGRPPGRA